MRGLELARQLPGIIGLVEEGHASAALVMRAHPTYTPKAMKCRARLHQCRALFAKSEHQKMPEQAGQIEIEAAG